jgi:hypothetical protein
MGEPFGKALRRNRFWNEHSPGRPLLDFILGEVLSLPINVKQTALQSLEERFTHVRLCTH